MAVVTKVFFDTSVLLGGLIELGETSAAPQALMDEIAGGRLPEPHTAWHCCLEFYSVSTRLPPEFRLHPQEALRLIEEELFGRFRIHQLPAAARKTFFQSAVHDQTVGGRIYDAHIADIARTTGVQLVVSENQRDFIGLLRHGVRVLSSAEFLGELS